MSRAAQVSRDFHDLADSIETRALGLSAAASWEAAVCKPWSTSAREKQKVDWAAKWFLWLWLAGRGYGKSWSLMGNAVDRWKRGAWRRTALIAPTESLVRKIVEEDSDSGLMAMCYAEGLEANYKSTRGLVEFGNGAKCYVYSAEKAGKLRNQQHDSAVLDEVREFVDLEAIYDSLIRGLRLGQDPRILAGTTPPGVVGARRVGAAVQAANREFMRGVLRGGVYVRREAGTPPPLMSRESTVVVTGSSDENIENVSPTYEAQAIAPYRGTRIGRQEVEGLFIDEVKGAILKREDFDAHRVAWGAESLPDLDLIGVAIDPAGGDKPENSETGIGAGGRGWPDGFDARGDPHGKAHGYMLADESGHHKPLQWARAACGLYYRVKADWVLGETNHGGDMVESNVATFDPEVPFRKVRASRGKYIRAAPALSLVQQGRVHHVGVKPEEIAVWEVLEDQLCMFTDDGYQGTGSPDRADWWVYVVSELLLGDQRVGYDLTF